MKIELGQAYSFIQPGIRHSQEDARFPDVDMPSLSQRVFIVCDGVGGNSKGEVASRTVCDALGNALTGRDGNKPLTEREFAIALGNAYSELKKVSTQAPDMAGFADLGMKEVEQVYRSMGITEVVTGREQVLFLDEQCEAIRLGGAYEDVPLYSLQLCLLRGEYVCVVTFTSYVEDNTEMMMKFFHPLIVEEE